MYEYVLCVCVCISSNISTDTYTYIHIHTYIQYKQNTDMLKMYVCVCIFGSIHTSYIQPYLHTYTYKHAGSLMIAQPCSKCQWSEPVKVEDFKAGPCIYVGHQPIDHIFSPVKYSHMESSVTEKVYCVQKLPE